MSSQEYYQQGGYPQQQQQGVYPPQGYPQQGYPQQPQAVNTPPPPPLFSSLLSPPLPPPRDLKISIDHSIPRAPSLLETPHGSSAIGVASCSPVHTSKSFFPPPIANETRSSLFSRATVLPRVSTGPLRVNMGLPRASTVLLRASRPCSTNRRLPRSSAAAAATRAA